jgi:hypothetical protein
LRQLLVRTVRHNAQIEVVLKDRPVSIGLNDPEYRYRSFFGKRNINIVYGGVEEYIINLARSPITTT